MKLRIRRSLIVCMTVVYPIIFSSCSTGREEARTATTEFRDRYGRGEYKQIYDATTAEFKKVTSEKDFVTIMEGLSRKLGTLKSAKEIGWLTHAGTGGRQVTIRFESQFEKGAAKEQFIWAINGKNAKLVAYNINSSVFVTN